MSTFLDAPSRRSVLSLARTLLSGIVLGSVATSCLPRKKNRKAGEKQPSEETSDASSQPSPPSLEGKTGVANQPSEPPLLGFSQRCSTSNSIPWKKFKQTEEVYTPSVKFYGDEQSALSAISFPSYVPTQATAIAEIYLAYASGELIAQKSLVEDSFLLPNGKLRPIIVDNLVVQQGMGLVCILKMSDNSFQARSYAKGIRFERTFRSRPVIHLTTTHVPSDDFFHHQAPAIIPPDPEDLSILDQGPVVRSNDRPAYLPNPGFRGFIITDLAGTLLSEFGEEFVDAADFDYFAAYKLVQGSYFARTIVNLS